MSYNSQKHGILPILNLMIIAAVFMKFSSYSFPFFSTKIRIVLASQLIIHKD